MKKLLVLLQIVILLGIIQGSDIYQHQFINGVKVIPHIQKRSTGGEDAYYADNQLISVADGVGGWQRHGIDPSKFSRSLCSNIGQLWKQDRNKYEDNLNQLIDDAHKQIKVVGSSTLVLATIDLDEPKIKVGYIGDSGYMLFRIVDNEVKLLYESKEQQHAFNFPYQLSYTPPSYQTQFKDDANIAIYNHHDVQDGDILLVASDGVFDNLFPEQILKIFQKKLVKYKVRDQMKTTEDIMADLSEMVGETAFEYSQKMEYKSPFASRAAEQQANLPYSAGGKQDDITVVVSYIQISDSNNQKQEKQDL